MEPDITARFEEIDVRMADFGVRLGAIERQNASLVDAVAGLVETLRIVTDPAAVRGIAQGMEDMARGETVDRAGIEALRRELQAGQA